METTQNNIMFIEEPEAVRTESEFLNILKKNGVNLEKIAVTGYGMPDFFKKSNGLGLTCENSETVVLFDYLSANGGAEFWAILKK